MAMIQQRHGIVRRLLSTTSSGNGGSLRAVAFIDLNFLDQICHSYGMQQHGLGYAKKLAVDLAPLLPFLAEAVSARMNDRPVEIVRTYAYGAREEIMGTNPPSSSSPSQSQSTSTSISPDPNRFNMVRASVNERFPTRAFAGSASGPAGILSSIAMSSDIVHAAAINPAKLLPQQQTTTTTTVSLASSSTNGIIDLDSGMPSALMPLVSITDVSSDSSSTLSPPPTTISTTPSNPPGFVHPFDILITICGFRYLPAVVRAAQHGKAVFVATNNISTSSSSSNTAIVSSIGSQNGGGAAVTAAIAAADAASEHQLWATCPPQVSQLVSRIRLDDVLPRIIRPAQDFRASGASLESLARSFAEALSKEVNSNNSNSNDSSNSSSNSNTALPGNKVVSLSMDLAKDLSRHRMSARALLARFPNAFQVEILNGAKWWVKLKPNWRQALKVPGHFSSTPSANNSNASANKNNNNTNSNMKKGENENTNAMPTMTTTSSATTTVTPTTVIQEPSEVVVETTPSSLSSVADSPVTIDLNISTESVVAEILEPEVTLTTSAATAAATAVITPSSTGTLETEVAGVKSKRKRSSKSTTKPADASAATSVLGDTIAETNVTSTFAASASVTSASAEDSTEAAVEKLSGIFAQAAEAGIVSRADVFGAEEKGIKTGILEGGELGVAPLSTKKTTKKRSTASSSSSSSKSKKPFTPTRAVLVILVRKLLPKYYKSAATKVDLLSSLLANTEEASQAIVVHSAVDAAATTATVTSTAPEAISN